MSRDARKLFVALLIIFSASGLRAQLVTSFEKDAGRERLRAGGVKATRVSEHATEGEWALKCVFPGSQVDTWPGLSFVPAVPDLRPYQLMAVDVYNASAQASQLSWRIDDLSGKKHFGSGIKLPPHSATRAEIFLRGLDAYVDMARVKQIYLYVRMPREDVVLYLDNLRFATISQMFTALVYEETAPAPELSEQDRARGYVLFSRHWLDVVFPNSHPRPGERVTALQAFAAPGEYEPLTLSVHALRDLVGAGVSVSALSCGAGRIPSSSVAVYPVRCLDKRVTYSSTKYVKDMPVLLERRPSADVGAKTCKRFWLDLHVPVDAAPGVYEGEVTFAAQGVAPSVLPLRLRVLPFHLREPTGRILGEYYRGPQLARNPEEERKFLSRDLRDMREHGMTSVGLCMGCPTKQATMADGTVILNLEGTSLYEHFMDTYRDLGFPAPIVQLSDSGQSFAAQQKAAFGSAEYAQAYTGFWRGMQAESKRRGWPEIVVQPVDEPGWQDQKAKDRNVELLKLCKSVPGLRTEQDGPGDGYFHGQAGPFSDVWNYNGAIAAQETVQAARAAGRMVMLYNCDVESYRPETGRYVAGFFQRRANIDGYYNWAYMSWRGSPYDDLDHKTGTWMHVYPEYKGEVGGPSTGWQGAREGVDDSRYVHTLEWAVERALAGDNAQAAAAARKARETLSSLLETLQYSPRVRNAARWTKQRSANGKRLISGTLKIANGWDFETYDVARWQVAESTWSVLAALGDVPAPPAVSRSVTAGPSVELLRDVRWRTAQGSEVKGKATVEVSIPKLTGAITLDGKASEPVWQSAALTTGFQLHKGGKPKQQTRVRVFADNTHLNFFFVCDEEYMGQITATIIEPGGPVWQDDCVEIFIDANLDRRSFYQVVVNSLGTVMTTREPGGKWRPAVAAVAVQGEMSWTVEIRVPLSELNLAGSTFGLNLCRERRPTEVMELLCWSPTGGKFGQPDKFGTAYFGTPYLQHLRLGAACVGPQEVSATVGNPGKASRSFELVFEWRLGTGETQSVTTGIFTLKPGQSRSATLPYYVAAGGANLHATVRLMGVADRSAIASQRLSQQIPAAVKLTRVPALVFAGGGSYSTSVALAVQPAWRSDTRLEVVLRDSRNAVLGRTVLPELAGDGIDAALDLSGVPAGAYRLEGSLWRGTSQQPLAVATKTVHLVRGPFAGRRK